MSIYKFQSKWNFSTPAVKMLVILVPVPYMEASINSLILQSSLNQKVEHMALRAASPANAVPSFTFLDFAASNLSKINRPQ